MIFNFRDFKLSVVFDAFKKFGVFIEPRVTFSLHIRDVVDKLVSKLLLEVESNFFLALLWVFNRGFSFI
jgi:hypothetical protein